MSEITEVKIVEGQNPKSTSQENTKVTVTSLEPKEEIWTLAQLEAKIKEMETNKANALNNYNTQVASFDAQIAKFQAITAEVEKALEK